MSKILVCVLNGCGKPATKEFHLSLDSKTINLCDECYIKILSQQKQKLTQKENCPNYDEIIGCWDCPRFDNEKGKKEICPFHKDQTYESQKKLLWTMDKIKVNSEFGKMSKKLKHGKIIITEKVIKHYTISKDEIDQINNAIKTIIGKGKK